MRDVKLDGDPCSYYEAYGGFPKLGVPLGVYVGVPLSGETTVYLGPKYEKASSAFGV